MFFEESSQVSVFVVAASLRSLPVACMEIHQWPECLVFEQLGAWTDMVVDMVSLFVTLHTRLFAKHVVALSDKDVAVPIRAPPRLIMMR